MQYAAVTRELLSGHHTGGEPSSQATILYTPVTPLVSVRRVRQVLATLPCSRKHTYQYMPVHKMLTAWPEQNDVGAGAGRTSVTTRKPKTRKT